MGIGVSNCQSVVVNAWVDLIAIDGGGGATKHGTAGLNGATRSVAGNPIGFRGNGEMSFIESGCKLVAEVIETVKTVINNAASRTTKQRRAIFNLLKANRLTHLTKSAYTHI